MNRRGEVRARVQLNVFARVEKLLACDCASFGVLGEPDVSFATFAEPDFYGAGPPRGIWVGARLKL